MIEMLAQHYEKRPARLTESIHRLNQSHRISIARICKIAHAGLKIEVAPNNKLLDLIDGRIYTNL